MVIWTAFFLLPKISTIVYQGLLFWNIAKLYVYYCWWVTRDCSVFNHIFDPLVRTISFELLWCMFLERKWKQKSGWKGGWHTTATWESQIASYLDILYSLLTLVTESDTDHSLVTLVSAWLEGRWNLRKLAKSSSHVQVASDTFLSSQGRGWHVDG